MVARLCLGARKMTDFCVWYLINHVIYDKAIHRRSSFKMR
jgi:hypothetical protein